ncbi:hypothetical protein AB3S75_027158 [Citrus x aurantiifolia]
MTVSVGPGTNNLWIENVACGPGHGIGIGSLGKDLIEAGVQNVTVKNCDIYRHSKWAKNKVMGETKQWFCQKNILFQHAVMKNVQNPIIIDQNYCPDNEGCPGKVRYQKDI